jgi:multimeric flavodoxin WrbA
MKVVLINGSQKTGESNSGIILDWINNLIKEKHEVEIYNSGISLFTDETFKNIVSKEVIILAFPLFLYSVPSQTLKMLIELENTIKREQANNLIMYTVINCGFYEGKQCNVAFKIIENWCEHSGVKFGGGIGQGAGEMLGKIKGIPLNKGPFNNLARALQAMIEKMELKELFETIYLSPYFPRFMWKIMATRFWNDQARKNGLKKKDIVKRL